ncbi:DUF281 domain-containing protein [Caenorhabditis elegans]|uniref:DUF281 domain-containing protein n=1 Tax=Caenorhabditis elegans TaxID=6239 RepID=P91177_CAEEL|nr:DUF281 domain-containing protein [Caenorhabditis elegans]CCD67771.1 DUF281 domain-containing protein [Caenorhabditis elegans]|eukprot:NP_491254.1 Uncharacterized protein CELE_C50F2.4 [Caenorhabditis elegans]
MRLDCSSFIFSLFSVILVVVADENDVQVKPALSQCKRVNPCGATISTYPLLEPDAEEASGFGSGAVPVYDEILTHEIYDLNATPEMHNFTLCSCPDDGVCDFESDSNMVKVDYHVTLRFCNLETISSTCKRYDVNLRVIGAAQPSGDSVQEVSNAMMFCNCQNGFSRQHVEVWSGQDISLNYKCL